MATSKEIAEAIQRKLESGSNKIVIGSVLAWEIVRKLRGKKEAK